MSKQPTAATAPAQLPLSGFRVLDLMDEFGAYGPRLLTSFGAEVIRLEHPRGSRARRRPYRLLTRGGEQAIPGTEPDGLFFAHYDGGKQGITLNLSADEGQALLARLLATVDLVLDNGQLERLGLDPRGLTAATPLVAVSLTPFGLHGPRSHWSGSDLVVQMLSGMTGLFGHFDERPARFGPEQASEMGGLAAALAAAIALFQRRRGGRGEFVDIAMEQVCALVTLQMWNASLYHQFGFRRTRRPRDEAGAGGLYRAADGYVALGAARRPAELLRMLSDAGHAAALPDGLERMPETRVAREPAVDAAVRAFTAERPRAELIETTQRYGLIGLAVNDLADVIADPFLDQRAFFVDLELPASGRPARDTGAPVRLSSAGYRAGLRPPLLGEHNAAVYGRLGLDGAELARLHGEGLI